MCNTLFYSLLIFGLLFEVITQDCENAQYEVPQPPENQECYTSVNLSIEDTRTCTYTCDDKPNITTIVDVVKGTLTVRFPLPPMTCGHTLYKVHLIVNEQVEEESACNESVVILSSDKHSTKEYRIDRNCKEEDCVVERCKEFGEVIFSHVFSSCYKLWVEPFIETSTRAGLHSCPFFISTNISKLRVADIQPWISVDCIQEENVCSVDVKYQQAISKTAIELLFSENGSRVHWAEVPVTASIERFHYDTFYLYAGGCIIARGCIIYYAFRSLGEVNILPNTSFESMIISLAGDLRSLEDGSCDRDGLAHSCCEVGKNGSICIPRPKVMAPTCNFIELYEKIQCKFYNMSPGNYCIRIKLTDDRCVHGTIWTVNSTACRWSLPFVVSYHPPNQQVISLPIASTLTAFLILLGVAIGGALVLVLFWRRVPPNTSWSAESSEEVGRPMIEGLKVLLLYPRDCQEFMKTMESFRKLLETYNIEVYDCHASYDVLNGPLFWLQKVMVYPKLCTVIVSTHCAYLQQQAIQRGCNASGESVYKDPIFIDSIFMYGLKIIMEDISADTYLKNFVIGYSGFSSDDKMLMLPTSFRRYCIPEHLSKLLVDMNLELSLENIQSTNSNEYMELKNNLDTLLNYIKLKPHYLDDLLNLI